MQIARRIEKMNNFFIQYLAAWFLQHANQQKDNRFLWIPVFLACGIGGYFSLPSEPPISIPLFLLICSLTSHIFIQSLHNRILTHISFGIFLVICGFSLAKVKTEYTNAPIIKKAINYTDIEGDILSIEPLEQGTGGRIILYNLDIENLSPEDTPYKVRLRLRDDKSIAIGQRISVLASLKPPSPPFTPGGFDFRRHLYFQQIGAVGFIYKSPVILKEPPTLFININTLRHSIASRITSILPKEQSAIAIALIVGHKHALSDDDKQAVRDAGLAHMLAISGLHIGLVAGTLFFLLRLSMATIPRFALKYPIKKIAAVFALFGAVFYMILAGATVPTQRAVLMSSIMFLAIILDRSPFSLRLISFSACIILIIAPESLLSASFHMSFAAVTCLVYFYDVTRAFWIRTYRNSGWHHKIALYFLGVCITTIIASVATAPFSAYHFGKISVLGSAANLVAVPLFGFLIMPFALIGLCLMPLSLDYIPFYIMGQGIDAMREIAYWAAAMPGAIVRTPSWDFTPFILFTCACLFMMIWKGAGKLYLLPIMALSICLTYTQVKPDILISPAHKLFLFRHSDNNTLYVSGKRNERFILENWEKYYGIPPGQAQAMEYKGKDHNKNNDSADYQCGEQGCRFTISDQKISFIRNAYIQKAECKWADIIISVEPVKHDLKEHPCQANIQIGKFETWKNGAHAIYITPQGAFMQTVKQAHNARPWSPEWPE